MNDKLRRQILFEAARLMQTHKENDPGRARIVAARRVSRGWVHPTDLPGIREVFATLQQIEAGGWPDEDLDPNDEDQRFDAFYQLLKPLSCVQQNKRRHPEGDLLYHSLQVFELLAETLPYDEEALLAGLLHDVGRGIDPLNHIDAGLSALSGLITERTAWLIEHQFLARGLLDGSIGSRARRRLAASEHFEELELLARADLEGRQPGMRVRDLEDALSYIREIQSAFD